MSIKLPELRPDATLSDVRSALADGARTLLELRSKPADDRGDTFDADAKSVIDFIHDANTIEQALAAYERGRVESEARGPRTGNVDLANDRRSMGEQVVGGDAYEQWATRGRAGGPFVAEVRNLLGGFTAGAYDSGSDGFLPVGSPVYVPAAAPRRRTFLRDVMSVQQTGLRVVPYVRELSPITNESGAAMTSEGSAKTEVTMQFENHSAIVEKITAWVPATDEILTDAPTLRGYIDTRLAYMLGIKEDDQIINGTGTSPEITGVETVSNTQTQSTPTGDFPGIIGNSIAKVENVYGEPNAVIANPLDYWAAVIKRWSTQQDNAGGGNAPSAEAGITWNLPAVRTRAVTSGKAYVGDFRIASTLFDRQETTIRVGDQHSDYFTRNLVVVLAEKRVGIAWHRPDLVVKATVPTS